MTVDPDRRLLGEGAGHPRATATAAHHQDLEAVLDWITADADFAAVRFRKASRDCPREKREQAIGAPEIRPATRLEIERAEQIKKAHRKRLTA